MSTRPSGAPFRGSLQVRFWCATYSPARVLDPLSTDPASFEVKPGGADWRPAKPGASFAELAAWLTDNGLAVRDTALVCERKRPWRGLYVLTIGPDVTH